MKPSIIKRKVPIALLHPWDKATISRSLVKRGKIYLRVGLFLFFAGAVAFLIAAPFGVLVASLAAIVTAGGFFCRAWVLAGRAYNIMK